MRVQKKKDAQASSLARFTDNFLICWATYDFCVEFVATRRVNKSDIHVLQEIAINE